MDVRAGGKNEWQRLRMRGVLTLGSGRAGRGRGATRLRAVSHPASSAGIEGAEWKCSFIALGSASRGTSTRSDQAERSSDPGLTGRPARFRVDAATCLFHVA